MFFNNKPLSKIANAGAYPEMVIPPCSLACAIAKGQGCLCSNIDSVYINSH